MPLAFLFKDYRSARLVMEHSVLMIPFGVGNAPDVFQ